MTDVQLYNNLTSIVGFGEVSSLAIRREGGLGWGEIHRFADAGLIRFVRCAGGVPIYLLMFP